MDYHGTNLSTALRLVIGFRETPLSKIACGTEQVFSEPGDISRWAWELTMFDRDWREGGWDSTQRIYAAAKRYRALPKEQKIDSMVKAGLLTPEQGERAKAKWAELQREKIAEEAGSE